jgi:hypothetical protein
MESMGTYVWPSWVDISVRLVLVVYLLLFGTVNEYQLLLSITPWKSYGTPPEQAQKIVGVDLIPGLDYHWKSRVYVETADGNEYRCCGWPGPEGWVERYEPLSNYYTYKFVSNKYCTEWLQDQWDINDDYRIAIDSANFSSCAPDIYVSYYIGCDGTVWGKMLDEHSDYFKHSMLVVRFLKGLSFFIIFLLFLTLFKKEGYSNRNYEAQ